MHAGGAFIGWQLGLELVCGWTATEWVSAMHQSQELTEEEIEDSGLGKVLASYHWVRCAFTYFESPTHYYLHALRSPV